MKEFQYKIKDGVGIHARPAGLLVKEAEKFLARNKGETVGLPNKLDGKLIRRTPSKGTQMPPDGRRPWNASWTGPREPESAPSKVCSRPSRPWSGLFLF